MKLERLLFLLAVIWGAPHMTPAFGLIGSDGAGAGIGIRWKPTAALCF